jgi:hypothetical protein
MKFLQNITKKKNIFQRIFGLRIELFNQLVESIRPLWEKAEEERKSSKPRKRKIGGGRPYKFKSLEEKILITLFYYKQYPTQEILAMIFGIDQSNISRLIQKMSVFIEQAADPEMKTYLAEAKKEFERLDPQQRITNWDDFLKKYPELKDVSTDALEQKCYRPKNDEQQKKHYSGKKKQHTIKVQISVSRETKRILDVSKTYPGSVHDKSVIDQEKTVAKFPEKVPLRFDSGYQGLRKEYPDHYLILPIKKPRGEDLSPLAKELNQMNSRRRVVVEHGIRFVKKFRICSSVYRGAIEKHNSIFRNVASLVNLSLLNPVASG